MSSPKRSGFSARIDAMAEDIRRLKLRTGSAASAPVGAWQDLEPLLGNGWTTSGVLGDAVHAQYYLDRERVWLHGDIEYTAGAGTDPTFPLTTPFPAGFRPARTTNAMLFSEAITGSPVTHDWWLAYFSAAGHINLAPNSTVGNPPSGTVLITDGVSYRTS